MIILLGILLLCTSLVSMSFFIWFQRNWGMRNCFLLMFFLGVYWFEWLLNWMANTKCEPIWLFNFCVPANHMQFRFIQFLSDRVLFLMFFVFICSSSLSYKTKETPLTMHMGVFSGTNLTFWALYSFKR